MKTSLFSTLAVSMYLGASFASVADENNTTTLGDSVLDEIGVWAMDGEETHGIQEK